MTQNWHSLPLQMMPINVSAATTPSPSWVDEFINFSPARRNTHRRSETDSIEFLPLLEECATSPPPRTSTGHRGNVNTGGFERLDDAQLMSMFSDEMEMKVGALVSSSDASTTFDHNSNDDDEKQPSPSLPPPPPQDHQKQQQLKEEPWEVDCSCKSNPPTIKPSNTADGNFIVDPKRVKRILANRQSAQRSRVRKLQYLSELERNVTTLQTEVSALSPRVAFFHHQRIILNVDNSTLKQRIAALAQDKIFKDASEEALRQEIERLRQVFCEQNNKNMAITTPPPTPVSSDDTH